MTNPAALVLAAGGSRRLGQPKQLIRMNGESLLRRTARLAIVAGCDPVLVVLGADAELMRLEAAGLGVECIVNEEWEQGMASSLRCGVEKLRGCDIDSLMVLVCDQPRLSQAILGSLIAAHHRTRPDITASTYGGVKGVPAIFDRKVFPTLAALKGDEGARKVIANPKWVVSTIEFADGEFDVDLPSDLDRL